LDRKEKAVLTEVVEAFLDRKGKEVRIRSRMPGKELCF